MTMAVVLARCSAPELVRSIAESGTTDSLERWQGRRFRERYALSSPVHSGDTYTYSGSECPSGMGKSTVPILCHPVASYNLTAAVYVVPTSRIARRRRLCALAVAASRSAVPRPRDLACGDTSSRATTASWSSARPVLSRASFITPLHEL